MTSSLRKDFEIDFRDPSAIEKIPVILTEYGVVVITNVFEKDECDRNVSSIVDAYEILSGDFKRTDFSTWDKKVLPPGPRDGLSQFMISNLQVVSDVRSDPRVETVFSAAYSGTRGRLITEFLSSNDGINLRPPKEPYYDPSVPDWAHIDNAIKGTEKYKIIQGQAVMTSTSACFRCSPKSHLIHDYLLEKYSNYEAEWCKFESENYDEISEKIKSVEGEWQIPVIVPMGSMILWFSETVHSACIQSPPDTIPLVDGEWKDWRCVIYVCLRPADELGEEHRFRLRNSYRKNRTTNHSGQKLFGAIPTNQKHTKFSERIRSFMKNPALVYDIFPPSKNPKWLKMLGFPDGKIDEDLWAEDIRREKEILDARHLERNGTAFKKSE